MPVHQGIVETHAESLGTSRLHVFRHQVASRALLRRAVIRQLRIPIAETLVVFSRQHHVFLAGLLGEFCPGAGSIRFGLKLLGELFVFGNGNALLLHRPFVVAVNAVQTPVNEHAEPGRVPPLHAALAVCHDCGALGQGCFLAALFCLLRRLPATGGQACGGEGGSSDS